MNEFSFTPIGLGHSDAFLTVEDVQNIVARAFEPVPVDGRRVLLIVPDATRTAPIGLMFGTIFDIIGRRVRNLDVMIALGTHQPMSEAQINQRLEISAAQRNSKYLQVQFFNHAWDDASQLETIGTISSAEIAQISAGRFAMEVPVQINRRVLDYDLVVIVGPVFPHEVVGFSGGNKYLFPGVGGPEILNFFHWLAAIITNAEIIGHKYTPVRRVIDRAASFVTIPKLAFCLAVSGRELSGLFAGAPEEAWSNAADLSNKIHVLLKPHAFHTVLSCAPTMYADLWTGGKCMYKLEPVVEDGGELIIYAPHIREVSVTHGRLIEEIGYHTRDYFVKQWDKFQHYPWGVLAHSTHVRGAGSFENGVEIPRLRVTLATQISPATCAKINLGYRDPASIRPEEFQNREDEGILYVPKAGEMLYRLAQSTKPLAAADATDERRF